MWYQDVICPMFSCTSCCTVTGGYYLGFSYQSYQDVSSGLINCSSHVHESNSKASKVTGSERNTCTLEQSTCCPSGAACWLWFVCQWSCCRWTQTHSRPWMTIPRHVALPHCRRSPPGWRVQLRRWKTTSKTWKKTWKDCLHLLHVSILCI